MDSQDGGFCFSATNKRGQTTKTTHPSTGLPSASRGDGDGGRRISWETPLASSSLLGSPRTSAGKGVESNRTPGSNSDFAAGEENGSANGGSGYNSRTAKFAPALGWSGGFASLPEVQMQVLVEVGKLVRAAARKGKYGKPCKEYL